METYLDAGHGSCFLKEARIAELVEKALHHFDGVRYRLLSWVVMPNHVHVLIDPLEGWALERIVHSWKSFTAHEANRILGRQGDFWQHDYWDRFIRGPDHLRRAIEYIHANPVRAGLVSRPGLWIHSSAGRPYVASDT